MYGREVYGREAAPRPYPRFACLLLSLAAGCAGGRSGGSGSLAGPSPSALIIDSIAPASDSNAVAGERVTFLVNAREEDGLTFRWSMDGVPQSAAGPSFQLQTTEGDTDTHTVAVEVDDPGSDIASILWRLRLVPDSENHPPAVTWAFPSTPVTLTQGSRFTFSLWASDPDAADTISFHWWVDGSETAESGSSFELDSTGMSPGAHQVDAMATDGRPHLGTDGPLHSFSLTVRLAPVENHAPVIQGVAPAGPISITAGSSLNLHLDVSDPDGDPLTYSWSVDGASEPGGSSTFRYAPTDSQVGSHAVQVKVSDGALNADGSDPSYTWTILVSGTASAPSPSTDQVTDPAPPPPPDPAGSSGDPAPPGESGTGSAGVTLEWDPVTADLLGEPMVVSGYRVYLADTAEGFGAPLASVPAPAAALSNLSSGQSYFAAVTAFDAVGNESPLSGPISFQAP